VGEDAPKLSSVALHFDEGLAKGGLLLALGERLLQQAPETVLFSLNAEDILNLLPGTRARTC